MTPETLPWDAADYLTDEEAIAGYLDAALEDGDPGLVAAALGDIVRARNVTDLAARTGLQPDRLSACLSGDGYPDLATVMKVVEALGLQLGARSKSKAADAA